MPEEGNGKDKPEEKRPLTMVIEFQPDGKVKLNFPLLHDKIASYGALKMAEKTLDGHYANQNKIIQPKGRILDFVRRKH